MTDIFNFRHERPRPLAKKVFPGGTYIIALLLCSTIVWSAFPRSRLPPVVDVWEKKHILSPSELEIIHNAIDEELSRKLPSNSTPLHFASFDEIMLTDPSPKPPGSSRSSEFDLACFIEELAWNHNLNSPYPAESRHRPSRCTHNSKLQPVHTASRLCSFIAGRKILIVGPEPSFHLHLNWLHALQLYENRTHICPGAEFCSSHHICLPPATTPEDFFEKGGFKKLPSNRELASTASASLRYALSTTLYASSDSKDPMYTQPQIDTSTGVRMRNSYWIGQAKKSDMIIMNRGPIPAPAWTYNGTTNGNWTFVNDLSWPNGSFGGVHVFWEGVVERRTIAAALHATIFTYLPSVLRTFQIMRNHRDIRNKHLLWQESWFIEPSCIHSQGHAIVIPRDAFLTSQGINHWVLYYNAQVYMQNYLLQSLLPRFDISYIPQAVPMYASDASSTHPRSTRPRECWRYPFGTPVEEIMRSTLLSGLWKAFEGLE